MKTESNLILLDFMGVAPKWNTWSKKWVYTDGFFCHISNTDREKVRYSMAEYAKYSTSWDWLMPVVEKCYSTNLYYRYKDESCRQFFEGGIELTTNIDDVWLACVEFVKWLNEQQ